MKVSDFGLCGYISDEKMMKTFCGSPCYCSPECLCRIQYDGRLSDVWSLGVILYAMVTGEHPWTVSNTSVMLRQIMKGIYSVPPYVSKNCKNLIQSMLKVNPKERITIEKIQEHPWFNILKRAGVPRVQSVGGTVPELTLAQLSEEAKFTSENSECGIMSPFKESGRESGELSSLPRLCIRSASVENFRRVHELGKEKKDEKPTKFIPLGTNRQRSVVNFQTRVSRLPLRTHMMTIKE